MVQKEWEKSFNCLVTALEYDLPQKSTTVISLSKSANFKEFQTKKSSGSWASMFAKLKLKEIDGIAPLGV
ncbi:hypothetical protein DICVIV_02318 [Dictyocaulus viviparus]|uniref:Uncharacterized protein n=1 Tax=Dictyocaulus viviparus TaxID=29172 RepID=A0A0D8Y442_DICVI|nr:hypothetical protein DICVIV_02318 [Dictyocaulus viviparus]